MDRVLSTEVLAGILVGLVVLILGLIALQIWSSLQIRRMSKTAYQEDIKVAQSKAVEIVSDAQTEAQNVLAQANETSVRAMAEAGKAAQKTNEAYQAELRALIERYNAELQKTLTRGDESFAALTTAAADSFNRRQETLNGQFDDVLEALSIVADTLKTQTTQTLSNLEKSIESTSTTLETFLKEGESIVKENVEKHLGALLDRAEEDVDAYRRARLTLLDRHIERLIEDVAVRVLHKKLTLDEHGDLALKALRDAKEHNVL